MKTWSLRSRISLGVVLLTALGFLASAIVAQNALQSYLTTQIDHELEAITGGTCSRGSSRNHRPSLCLGPYGKHRSILCQSGRAARPGMNRSDDSRSRQREAGRTERGTRSGCSNMSCQKCTRSNVHRLLSRSCSSSPWSCRNGMRGTSRMLAAE